MISRKVETDSKNCVEQASDALRELIDQGVENACERILLRFPQLHSDVDGLLEVIYLESILRQDRDPNLTVSELTAEYTRRFPEYQHDIVKLLEVNQAFASLGLNMPGPSGSHPSGGVLPASWELSIGSIGEYQLLEVLGQGGMGVVYRAIQTRLSRVVAIKTIAAERADGATISRFQKEAELASSLQHPNIVQIYEVGVHDELPFYSMELVAGGSLAEFLKEHPLRPDRAAKLVAVLARAVDFAHSRGIVHRDLKPANILLSPSARPEALKFHDSRTSFEGKAANESADRFEPKIVDFGLAIQMGATSAFPSSGRAAGTPSYMAPEQIDPTLGPSTAVTDVYALGSILYHALVGRPPFYAASTQETLRQVRDDEPISPRKLQPKISSDLETICLKCLRKSPATRYSSAAALADDLQRYLDGKPILARPASYPELAYKWAVRNPSLVGLIAAMLLTIVSTTWLWRQSATSLAAEISERRKSEQLSYDRNIALAHLEYESHNVDRALDILNQCDPKFRNFEWHLVHKMCNEPEWECKSVNSERLTSAALSPDGRLAATGHGYWGDDTEQTINVWDIRNNKLLWKLKGHPKSEISSVDFHPTANRLLTGAMVWRSRPLKGELREWDLETGQLIRVVSGQDIRTAIYSADGKRIYAGEAGGKVCIYDADSAKLLLTCSRHKQLVLSICESSDGKLIATSGRDGTIAVWDVATGKELTWLNHMGDPRDVNWTMDMSRLIVSGFGGRVDTFRWRDRCLELESTTSQSHTVVSRFSPDGQMLVTGVSGEGVKLLDASDGHVMRVLHGHRAQVRALDFDRTGQKLLTAGADGSLRLWNLVRHRGYTEMTYLQIGEAQSIVNRPHSSQFAISLGVQLSKPRGANRGGDIVVYDALEQKTVQSFTLKNRADGTGNFPTMISYSPSGNYLCAGSLDNSIFVWDSKKTAPRFTLLGHKSVPIFTSMPDEDHIISIDKEGNLKVWNVTEQREDSNWPLLSTIQTGLAQTRPAQAATGTTGAEETRRTVRAAAIDFNKKRVAIGINMQLCLLDLDTQKLLHSIELETAVNQIAFSPDSTRMAVGTTSPKTLVFDITNAAQTPDLPPPLELIGNREQVTALTFSPDSRRLASLGRDEALRLYELELGNELLKLESGSLSDGVVAFSNDGNQLIRVTTHHVYTYSLQRIDPKAHLSDELSVISWHRDKYQKASENLQTYGAAFHSRELMALEPDTPVYKLFLANALMDEGKLEEAKHWIERCETQVALLQFKKACYLVRIALLQRDMEAYRDNMIELECLAHHINRIDQWNDLVWYGSLVPRSPIQLKEAITHLEKLSKKSRSGIYYNSLALAYYRTRNYPKSLTAATESMSTTVRPTPLPIDFLIRSLCQIPLLSRSLPQASGDPAAEADRAKSFRTRADGLQAILEHIEKHVKESRQRRSTVEKLTQSESDLYQLEIPLLLAELEKGMQQLNLNHRIFDRSSQVNRFEGHAPNSVE